MPNTKKFSIRKANVEDCSLILSFISELADFEKLKHEVVATTADLEKSIFEDKKADVLIAEVNKAPVGFALFFESYSTFLGKPGLYLEDLYISPKHRGLGYGTQLLRYLAAHAKSHHYERLEWSVLNWNQKAIALYDKIGAKPQKDWTVYRLSGEKLADFSE